MPRHAARVFAAVILLFAPAGGRAAAAAPDLEAASAFIADLGERTFKVLRQPGRDRQAVETAFRTLLQENLDTDTIGRFVLGRSWNSATPEQRQEYLRLLEEFAAQTYGRRFGQYMYSGQVFLVEESRLEGGGDVIVESQVMPRQRPAIDVSWRLRERGGQFRIIDIVVDGISLMVTQRNAVSSVMERSGGSIDAALDDLRVRTADDEGEP